MSEDLTAGDMSCCASCGTAEVDNSQLKKCACKLVKYCSIQCQKNHRPQHKKECKKRVAALHDQILIKQPESSHMGDCPICFLPLLLDVKKSTLMACCSKTICKGCQVANTIREMEEMLEQRCPFCRDILPTTQTESNKNLMRRAEANDPVALRELGKMYDNDGDYKSAFQYWTKAAVLGDAEAHCQISNLHWTGQIKRDTKKGIHHLEQAAIGGHPTARYNLGTVEADNGNLERAAKHHVIATNLGFDESAKKLREYYKRGWVTKETFAAALRAHQAAVNATKSPHRDAADERLRGNTIM